MDQILRTGDYDADFRDWCKRVTPAFNWDWAYLRLIQKELGRITRGENDRLMIFCPPRHGKSAAVTIRYPAFRIVRDPSTRVIVGCYSADLAFKFSRQTRRLLVNEGIPLTTERVDDWETSAEGGGRYIGVGGGVTGMGANCLPHETIVKTDIGPIEIGTLAQLNYRPQVASFDHALGQIVYRRVLAFKQTWTDELYEITTDSGHQLRATGQHLLFIPGQGYIQAAHLRVGDRLIIGQFTQKQNLCQLWQGKAMAQSPLSALCSVAQENGSRDYLRVLFQKGYEKGLRDTESHQARPCRSLLFHNLFKGASCCKESPSLQDLQQSSSKKDPPLLFGYVSSSHSSSNHERMPELRKSLSGKPIEDAILFEDMRKCGSFQADARRWQFKLQGWNQLCQMVSRDAAFDHGAGQISLCGMSFDRQNYGSATPGLEQNAQVFDIKTASYRSRSDQQCCRESRGDVSDMPYETSQVRHAAVAMVKRIRTQRLPVYDIQVEGTSNFFADNILVHNCLIIDDPVKSRAEANSKAYRERCWDWYQDDLLTRLEPGGALILIQTRWHHSDLAGRILDSEEAPDWAVLNLPALAEVNDPLGRREGEALCPDRYDEAALARLKRLLADSFLALYQQRPTLETGEIIKREWFRYYRAAPAKFKLKIHSWDTAYKPGQLNDPSVRTTWGETHEGYYLLDCWRARVEYPALKRQVIRDAERDQPDAILIEDKSSGQSLIQELRRDTRLPIVAISPEGDKLIRASTASVHYESGQVFHPEHASWISEYEAELLQFPAGSTDDQVDSMSQALTWLARRLRHGGVASAGKREFS